MATTTTFDTAASPTTYHHHHHRRNENRHCWHRICLHHHIRLSPPQLSSPPPLALESFRIRVGTRRILSHLVIIALDQKAFLCCLEAYVMTPHYLKMMWARIDFLRSVLEMGYNFVFTDADVMWFRDPFPQFYEDADFHIACDHFFGTFYKFRYFSRETYLGFHDQDVLNIIKFHPTTISIGLKIKFLDTAYFGGFYEPSKDLNQVCTMHANYCKGLGSKLHDLRIMVQNWKRSVSLPPNLKRYLMLPWVVPHNCRVNEIISW
ncbi:hypothetical protein D8674_043017 [Pyrus ussuriensis x Pyrus communis]|uniref:Nucleotide-diphospho-sugar transferase domain-containing protein n=1 Tax=Pyrus ussuriensis x Pyrus communis TaxID=2448454 RepID=A0A5N5GWY3_9ROSA|nr:hypothetical protein D8674_037089 [Pyrus ussuriensis x Pyrus communis]KAB2620307.1 hypothetical protein D8674_043017 [Pyrus ussuriensis x Pyrus communis]